MVVPAPAVPRILIKSVDGFVVGVESPGSGRESSEPTRMGNTMPTTPMGMMMINLNVTVDPPLLRVLEMVMAISYTDPDLDFS